MMGIAESSSEEKTFKRRIRTKYITLPAKMEMSVAALFPKGSKSLCIKKTTNPIEAAAIKGFIKYLTGENFTSRFLRRT